MVVEDWVPLGDVSHKLVCQEARKNSYHAVITSHCQKKVVPKLHKWDKHSCFSQKHLNPCERLIAHLYTWNAMRTLFEWKSEHFQWTSQKTKQHCYKDVLYLIYPHPCKVLTSLDSSCLEENKTKASLVAIYFLVNFEWVIWVITAS